MQAEGSRQRPLATALDPGHYFFNNLGHCAINRDLCSVGQMKNCHLTRLSPYCPVILAEMTKLELVLGIYNYSLKYGSAREISRYLSQKEANNRGSFSLSNSITLPFFVVG
jgi:hypothetical protein